MNYKKTGLHLIITLMFMQLVQSQIHPIELHKNTLDYRVRTFNYFSEPIKGSPYLFKEFIPAKISLLKEVCLVNFDAYDNQMEIDKSGKFYYLPRNNFNYTVEFVNLNKTYKLFKFDKNNEIITGFFQILTTKNGAYLLKKERIKRHKAKIATHGYEKSKPVTFQRMKDSYFMSFEKNKALEIPSKKKHFASLFNNHYNEITAYMKLKKLSHKKEKDLIQIFEYYVSIN